MSRQERAPADLAITGARIATDAGPVPGILLVRDGRIQRVAPADERIVSAERVAADHLTLLPGIIDTHVHTRDPGVPEREDFVSGTSAAAAGGITTILEMPIAKLPVNSAEAVTKRVGCLEPRAIVDFGLYGGAGVENLDTIAEQAAAGIVAFKTFMLPPPAARRDEFVGLWAADTPGIRDAMFETARTGLPHAFHCEHAPLVDALERRLAAGGRTAPPVHAEARPSVVEDIAVATMLALAGETGGRVHVVHLSSPAAAALVRSARQRSIPVTAETCPQYLWLTADALERHGPYAKCNPSLRTRAEVDRLWDFLIDGTIDVLGSDHSPFLAHEKDPGWANIFLAPPGLGGLETLLPLMLTAVNHRRITLERLVYLMARRPAELFRLSRKGRLDPGCDADFTLVDLAAEWDFQSERGFSRSSSNMRVYDGWPMRGRVVSTWVRGVRVYHDGAVTGRPGHGRFVRPGCRTDG